MNGNVDAFGRALVSLSLGSSSGAAPVEIQAWIDTAFNGELVVPRKIIEAAQLEQSAGIDARLADGSTVLLETFASQLHWFGETRAVEVIANDGEFPLLGIGLLTGRRLIIDYQQSLVTIE